MSDRNNIDILKDSYAAFGRGDLAAILRDVDPNVEWEEPGPKGIPWAGSFRGHTSLAIVVHWLWRGQWLSRANLEEIASDHRQARH